MKSNTYDINRQGSVSRSNMIIVSLIKNYSRKRATEISIFMTFTRCEPIRKKRGEGS